jgi:hypothetical protein
MAELSQGYGKAMAELWQDGLNAGGTRFILFSIGKSARGLALIEMPFLRREKFVIK